MFILSSSVKRKVAKLSMKMILFLSSYTHADGHKNAGKHVRILIVRNFWIMALLFNFILFKMFTLLMHSFYHKNILRQYGVLVYTFLCNYFHFIPFVSKCVLVPQVEFISWNRHNATYFRHTVTFMSCSHCSSVSR